MQQNAEKATENFKAVIQQYLDDMAKRDPDFQKVLDKENKNIDSCCAYIINTVRKTGHIGFTDSKIYSIAIHYYEEDDIENKPLEPMMIVSNNEVKLTDEEKEQLKKEAREAVIEEEKKRIRSVGKKPSRSISTPKIQQGSLF